MWTAVRSWNAAAPVHAVRLASSNTAIAAQVRLTHICACGTADHAATTQTRAAHQTRIHAPPPVSDVRSSHPPTNATNSTAPVASNSPMVNPVPASAAPVSRTDQTMTMPPSRLAAVAISGARVRAASAPVTTVWASSTPRRAGPSTTTRKPSSEVPMAASWCSIAMVGWIAARGALTPRALQGSEPLGFVRWINSPAATPRPTMAQPAAVSPNSTPTSSATMAAVHGRTPAAILASTSAGSASGSNSRSCCTPSTTIDATPSTPPARESAVTESSTDRPTPNRITVAPTTPPTARAMNQR